MDRLKSATHNTSRTVDTVRRILRDICDKDLPGRTIIIDIQRSARVLGLKAPKEGHIQSAIQGMVDAGEIRLLDSCSEASEFSTEVLGGVHQSGLALQKIETSIATAIINKRVGYRMS